MTAIPNFTPCRDRINRAEAKFKALVAEFLRFQQNHPYTVSFKKNSHGCYTVIIHTGYTTIPPDFALEFGEILYQIRAALDGTIFICGRQDCIGNFANYQQFLRFPIFDDRHKFKSAMGQMCLTKQREAILDAVQPYTARPIPKECEPVSFIRALDTLNKWAIMDRHRELHIVSVIPVNQKFDISLPITHAITSYTWHPPTYLIGDCEVLDITIAGPTFPVQVETKGKVTFEIGLDEPSLPVTTSRALAPRLNAMLNGAWQIIQTLEDSYR